MSPVQSIFRVFPFVICWCLLACSGPATQRSGDDPKPDDNAEPDESAQGQPVELPPLFAPLFVVGNEARFDVHTNDPGGGDSWPLETFEDRERVCVVDAVWHDAAAYPDTIVSAVECTEAPNNPWIQLWVATPEAIWHTSGWPIEEASFYLKDELAEPPLLKFPLIPDEVQEVAPSSDEWGTEVIRNPKPGVWCHEVHMEDITGYTSDHAECLSENVGLLSTHRLQQGPPADDIPPMQTTITRVEE